jgi:hypothetical protein
VFADRTIIRNNPNTSRGRFDTGLFMDIAGKNWEHSFYAPIPTIPGGTIFPISVVLFPPNENRIILTDQGAVLGGEGRLLFPPVPF